MYCVNFPVRIDDQLLVGLVNSCHPYNPRKYNASFALYAHLTEYSQYMKFGVAHFRPPQYIAIRSDVFSSRKIS